VSENKFALVNGIKICYKIHGKKNSYPIICVHGFGSKKETWICQVDMLSEKFKVINYDLRGSGMSERPDKPFTIEMLADDLASLMDFLGIENAHLLGFSLGGMVIQNFVIKYPERVNKIVLINTSAGILQEEGIDMFKNNQLRRIELIKQDAAKVFWQDAKAGFYTKFRKQMKANPKKKFHGIWSAEDLIEYIKTDPSTPKDVENQAYAVKSHNTYDRLSEIKNEVLLISASHDRLVPRASMLDIHKRIPNSIFKVIDKAGHEVHRSNAPEVNKIILDFLES